MTDVEILKRLRDEWKRFIETAIDLSAGLKGYDLTDYLNGLKDLTADEFQPIETAALENDGDGQYTKADIYDYLSRV